MVESVVPEFAGGVRTEKIVVKTRAGAERFQELAADLGRLPPVPSIFLDGELLFDATPDAEELRETLRRRMSVRAVET